MYTFPVVPPALSQPHPHGHSGATLHHIMSDSLLSQPANVAAEFNYGMRYLVADCGGGTVDLTVHELEEGGKLTELYKATGGAWGSMGVDCQFEILLVDIFGEEFLVDFVQNKPISWMELMSTFETKKRSFSPHKHLTVNLPLPFALIEYYRERNSTTVESAMNAYGNEKCDHPPHPRSSAHP